MSMECSRRSKQNELLKMETPSVRERVKRGRNNRLKKKARRNGTREYDPRIEPSIMITKVVKVKTRKLANHKS